jgi:HEAT repeat protein
MSRIVIVGCTLVLNALCSTLPASERLPSLSLTMDDDPRLVAPIIQYVLPVDWAILWQDALTAPEEDLRRAAAIALMRLRQEDAANIAQMNTAMLEGFRTTTDRIARLSIATALIQLDVREAAADLHQFASSGNIAVAHRIEPALARWKFEPIQTEWLKRIQKPAGVTATHLVLAAQGLAASGNKSVVPGLLKLATDEASATRVRIAAATAWGSLSNNGLTDVCQQLAADLSQDGFVNRLVAANMLSGHDDESSKQVLLALAQDSRPAIAAVALQRLLETDPQSVRSIDRQLLKNADSTVRRLAAQSLVKSPSAEAVQQLADLLNDRHPGVRNYVRESLEVLAKQDSLRDTVLQHAFRIIAGNDWRGLEQTARLFGSLDHEPAAERLVELLEHKRTEVFVTAGWALRELAVAATLPAIHEFVLSRNREKLTTADNVCFTYLFEAFGQAKYLAAAPILRSFVPPLSQFPVGVRERGPGEPAPENAGRQALSRSAAIWALGYVYESDPPRDLVQQFAGRLSAAAGYPPSEDAEVGIAAAISLGRMNALAPVKSAADIHGHGDLLYEACQWAIAQITGNEQPITPPARIAPRNPFLRPIAR